MPLIDCIDSLSSRDLLQHEAHRHPYLGEHKIFALKKVFVTTSFLPSNCLVAIIGVILAERLAQMYLMKMHQPGFNSNAGAVWRQLFVVAMMPWMRKHRVFSDVRLSQSIEALARYKLEAEEDAEGFVERFGEDVDGMRQAGWQAGTSAVAEVAGMTKAGAEMGVCFVTNSSDSAEQQTAMPSAKAGNEETSGVNP